LVPVFAEAGAGRVFSAADGIVDYGDDHESTADMAEVAVAVHGKRAPRCTKR
jgi:hypothetical protein